MKTNPPAPLGWLWRPDQMGSLAEKLVKPRRRYREKFGTDPAVCYLNPADLPEAATVTGIALLPVPTVQRGYMLFALDAEYLNQ